MSRDVNTVEVKSHTRILQHAWLGKHQSYMLPGSF